MLDWKCLHLYQNETNYKQCKENFFLDQYQIHDPKGLKGILSVRNKNHLKAYFFSLYHMKLLKMYSLDSGKEINFEKNK